MRGFGKDGGWERYRFFKIESRFKSFKFGEQRQNHVKIFLFKILQQLVDVAKGLRYLHSHDIVHGDLKAVGSIPT